MRSYLTLLSILLFSLHTTAQDFVKAQPVGGKQQLLYFIDQELIYPESMLQKKTECVVSFHFATDEKGRVTGIWQLQSPDTLASLETLRIFRLIEWTPATYLGFPTADSLVFKIEFNIKKYNKLCKSRGYRYIVYPYEPIDSSGVVIWHRKLEAAPYPVFTENDMNLSKFIATHLQYPELAIRQNLIGAVKLNFIVETNGRISNMYIEKSLGAGCNEEAIRILRMLKWMPGILHGMAVRTNGSLTITFNLDKGNGIINPSIKSSYGG